MSSSGNDNEDDVVAISALMREARGTYARAINARLAARGVDPLPRNAPFVLARLAGERPADHRDLTGVLIETGSQLIDVLKSRGYLQTPPDGEHQSITVTADGRAVAEEISVAVRDIDLELARRLSPSELDGLSAGLRALAKIDLDRTIASWGSPSDGN